MPLIKKQKIPLLVDKMLKKFDVIGPVPKDEKYVFSKVSRGEEVFLGYDTSILPPKKIFFPQEETLITFKKDEQLEFKPALEDGTPSKTDGDRKFVIFGVHACDIHAILTLDKQFMEVYPDPYYISKRARSLIIGVSCREPKETCFCGIMGTYTVEKGFDLFLEQIDEDEFYVIVGSDEGRKLLSAYTDFFEASTEETLEKLRKVLKEKDEKFADSVSITGLPTFLEQEFDSVNGEIWEELGEKCLGCGTCCLVCPTCYCFNVIDKVELSGKEGLTKRVWDSCLLADFAVIAGGFNFRPTQTSRIRYRIYHKLKYELERGGILGCVGCGRCNIACPAGIKMQDVIKKIKGE